MATCNIASGHAKGCRGQNFGGVEEVYITHFTSSTTVTSAAGVVTTIAPSGSFYTFVPLKDSSNLTENYVGDITKGTALYESTLTLVFDKYDVTARNQILLLGQDTNWIIVKDNTATYWLLGEDRGVDMTAGVFNTGTAPADGNTWTVTFMAREKEPNNTVDASIIAGLKVV